MEKGNLSGVLCKRFGVTIIRHRREGMYMLTVNQEMETLENGSTVYKKDLYWKVEGQKYVLRNVPFVQADYEEENADVDVSTKVMTMRELMLEAELPSDLNYEIYTDIEF